MPDRNRLIWSRFAADDLRKIRRHYVRTASPEVADRIVREIDGVARRISRLPLTGRNRDELAPGLRSALARPYTIFYRIGRIGAAQVQIVRVLHERRDFYSVLRDNER